ncbi:MAG: GNAT family N-acetyltransferase [bacterium]|nr:GNAT family N-acetyltransferase [bacterium]
MKIRELLPSDYQDIKTLVEETGLFTDEEIRCALELVSYGLSQHKEEEVEYLFKIATDDSGRLEGYACYGRTPLTDGVFDIYWIVVRKDSQYRGFGSRLLKELEEDIKIRGGRKIFIETSSKDDYEKARQFYTKKGYKLIAKIPDFYKVGDDKLIYMKDIPRTYA